MQNWKERPSRFTTRLCGKLSGEAVACRQQDRFRAVVDRFVASFVGDTNRLRGKLLGVAAREAVIALGSVQVRVSGEHLSGASPSASVDLFVRPESPRIDSGGPGMIAGRIAGLTYHGGHVDIRIASDICDDGLLLLRAAGDQAMTQ